jgi:hypothetical protein
MMTIMKDMLSESNQMMNEWEDPGMIKLKNSFPIGSKVKAIPSHVENRERHYNASNTDERFTLHEIGVVVGCGKPDSSRSGYKWTVTGREDTYRTSYSLLVKFPSIAKPYFCWAHQ